MRRATLWGAMLAALALAGVAGAQTAAPATGPYALAADDVIGITVINFKELSTEVVVPPDGKISVQLLEPVRVTGMTTDEVARTLAEKWRRFVVNPSVTVSLIRKHPEFVVISGFVAKAGSLEYKPGKRVLEAMAEAGGSLPQGDLRKVTVTHRDGQRQSLDLSKPETKGGTEVDLVLQSGDTIYVPERRMQITVVGQVTRPGSFDYRDEMTVMNALSAAEGIKLETADLAHATLAHEGQKQTLDLDAMLNHGDLSGNMKLAAGDEITVPEIRNRVYLLGAIAKTGYYAFKDGDRVVDALNWGGVLREGDLIRVHLIRINNEKGSATVKELNIDRFLRKGDMAANAPLQAGDVLFVPIRRKSFSLQDVFGALSGLNLINNAVGILRRGIGDTYYYR